MTLEAICLNYRFQEPALLKKALIHPGYAPPKEIRFFERLEFLGDRVLGVVMAHWLYDVFPKEREGDLAKRYAVLVSRETCLTIAHKVGLSHYLPQEEQPFSPAHLSNTMEAIIGSLYLDGGLEPAHDFIHHHWATFIKQYQTPPQDAKTLLQEWLQKKGEEPPHYEMISRKGPDHAPLFVVRVWAPGYGESTAEAASKRAAEQRAAHGLLEKIQHA
jgi:ribonuclease-3